MGTFHFVVFITIQRNSWKQHHRSVRVLVETTCTDVRKIFWENNNMQAALVQMKAGMQRGQRHLSGIFCFLINIFLPILQWEFFGRSKHRTVVQSYTHHLFQRDCVFSRNFRIYHIYFIYSMQLSLCSLMQLDVNPTVVGILWNLCFNSHHKKQFNTDVCLGFCFL